MTSYVSRFRDGDKDQKDLLGGKGANLAEMTKLDLPVPPGFTITTEACRAYMRDGHVPPELRVEVTLAVREIEDTPRPAARGLPRAAAGLGAVRGEVLHARDDGDGPEHRAQRRVREGADRVLGRRAVRLGLLPAAHPDVRQDRARDRRGPVRGGPGRAQDRGRRGDRRRPVRAGPARARPDVQGDRRRADRPRVPAAPPRAARHGDRGGPRLVEHRPRPAVPASRAHPARPGHRGQRGEHGVRQPRRDVGDGRLLHAGPVDGGDRRLRRLPAERAGRGRRRGDPQHPAAGGAGGARPGLVRRAAARDATARDALPRPVRHRVHHRARQAVAAADAGGQADRGGGVPDRDRAGRREPHHDGRGDHPLHGRQAQPAAVPAVRRRCGPAAAHPGDAGVPGRGRGRDRAGQRAGAGAHRRPART